MDTTDMQQAQALAQVGSMGQTSQMNQAGQFTPEQMSMLQSYMDDGKKKEERDKERIYEEFIDKNHKFWNTLPVPRMDEKRVGGVVKEFNQGDVKEEEYHLPKEFEWSSLDLRDKEVCEEVVKFLNKYNNNTEFRPNYTNYFLEWLLGVGLESYNPNYCLGVRVSIAPSSTTEGSPGSGRLAGLIAGQIVKTQVNRHILDMGQVELMCIHPKLRNKRLCTVLIKELIRRYQINGYTCATYTTYRHVAKPLCTINNYHRAINLKVLLESGFTKVQNVSLKSLKKAYRLPEEPANGKDKFVKMKEEHVEKAYEVLNEYMNKYNYHPIYSEEEFRQIFFNNKVVTSFVVLDDDGNVTDFSSYYLQPARVCNSKKDKHPYIRVGYLFYYTSLLETSYRMVKDTLIMAKKGGVDVIDAYNVMENENLLKELMFEEGRSKSYYYLYNRYYETMNNDQVCKVFVL